MPETKNSITISSLPARISSKKFNVAAGMDMSRIQNLVQLHGDETAPHFVNGQEPIADGRTYKSTNEQSYYRPQLRVAKENDSVFKVWFLKENGPEGMYRLEFWLEEDQTAYPSDAKPFNINAEKITLRWKDENGQEHKRDFPQPLLEGTNNNIKGEKSSFSIRVESQLQADEVQPLFHALSRSNLNTELHVTLSYSYWLDKESSPITKPDSEIVFDSINKPGKKPYVVPNLGDKYILKASGKQLVTPLNEKKQDAVLSTDLPKRSNSVLFPTLPSFRSFKDKPIEIVDKAEGRKKQTNYKTVSLNRVIPFVVFDGTLEFNKTIFSAIVGTSLPTSFMRTDFGMICIAPFPNTVYRLPDEFRLSYNQDLKTPHMIPVLYPSEDGDGVRVTFGITPWHDPKKLVELRDHLYQESHGELAFPDIVVGGYEKAEVKLTSAFPEFINTLSQENMEIDLDGFQIVLDLTIEFYKNLAELLTGPVGLTGEVTVTLMEYLPGYEEPQLVTKHIPMRLNFNDLAGLRVEPKVPENSICPDQVQLINMMPMETSMTNCVPRLLQIDNNSAVPLKVFEAVTVSPSFPITLPPQDKGLTDVKIEPVDKDSNIIWNAIAIELIGQELIQTPTEVLDRIHQVEDPCTVSWIITAECPSFLGDSVPSTYQTLYKLEVQILREGHAPQQLFLGRGNEAKVQISMKRSLKELLNDVDSPRTFKYHVRNIYYDHQGGWGSEKISEVPILTIFPNPIENDFPKTENEGTKPGENNSTYAYITNGGSNNVSVIDITTNNVTTTVPVGSLPEGVAVSPDGRWVYVANLGSNTVSVIDTTKNNVTATVKVGTKPKGVAITPDGTKVYVTNYGDSTTFVINTSSNTVTARVDVGNNPFGVAVAGTKAYVTNDNDSTVSVIDTSTDTITATVNMENQKPGGIAVTETKAYVTSGSTNNVYVIDTATSKVTDTVPVGNNPKGVAVVPDGTKVYVANFDSNNVSVINTSTKTVEATITVGKSPYGVAVTPDGREVYVTNDHENTVSIIDTGNNTVTAAINVGSLPKTLGQFIGTLKF